jgi:hypothetical protein
MGLWLEWAKVLLSAAPISGLVAFVFMLLFRAPLRKLIGRTSGLKGPGFEWSASQVERAAEAGTAPSGSMVTGTADAPSVPTGLTLSPEDQSRLADIIRAEHARAALWEYRFLNLYLAPHTQMVLDWFATIPNRPTIQFCDEYWSAAIPNLDERKAVLNALLSHQLLQATGPLLEITPKGREYLKFRGPRAVQEPARTKVPLPANSKD